MPGTDDGAVESGDKFLSKPVFLSSVVKNLNGSPKTPVDGPKARETTVPELTNIAEPTTDTVFEKIISADATELEITQKHLKKIQETEHFNRSGNVQQA